MQDNQGALQDSQGALQDYQGALQDSQGSLPGKIHKRGFHLRDALQRRLHIPVPRPFYPKPKHMRWYQQTRR